MGLFLGDLGDFYTTVGAGVQGTNLFLGAMPDAPASAVCIYETGGLASDKGMGSGPSQVAAERPSAQFVSRAVDYAAARANLQPYYVATEGMAARTINGTRYQWAACRQPPFKMGVDAQQRQLVVFNADFIRDFSTSTS